MADDSQLSKSKKSLLRVQKFKATSLVRKDELGAAFAFDAAVEPAKRLISLFKLLPVEHLEVFPDQQLSSVQQAADTVFSYFESILEFDPSQADAATTKQQLVKNLEQNYQAAFSNMFPFVSFAVARTVDFNQLSSEGRAAVQAIKDETSELLDEVKATSSSAQTVLQEVREAAAEQGVTQMAKYFSDEAVAHESGSKNWEIKSYVMAGLVTLYAFATLFFGQIEILTPSNVSEAIQITTSKILLFFVLAFLLFQCVSNYRAHRHNIVVNRHRQNALMTFTTLAEAGNSVEARDAVLQHAAAAIYAPNDSGYSKNEERGYSGNPVIGVMPKAGIGAAGATE